MTNLYTNEDYQTLLNEKKKCMIFMISFAFAVVLGLLLFVLLAKFETRLMFKIIGSIVEVLLSFLLIFFISKFTYSKRLEYEYFYLLNEEEKIIKCTIVKISNRVITFSDKSRVREITILVNEDEKIYYMSEIFDCPLIESCDYRISVAADYIKGFEEYEK